MAIKNKSNNILISETFYSIQGEGPQMGTPAIFIRCFGCNFNCAYCDSKYAWDYKIKTPTRYKIKSFITKLKKLIIKTNCLNFIFTGGEPLLQQSAITQIIKALPKSTFSIETNGSIKTTLNFNQINISYKLDTTNVKPYLLQIKPSKNTIYKFVISKQTQIKNILDFCKQEKIPQQQIYLMPEGKDQKSINQKSIKIIDQCKKYGLKFSPRLQIMLWGNKSGI